MCVFTSSVIERRYKSSFIEIDQIRVGISRSKEYFIWENISDSLNCQT